MVQVYKLPLCQRHFSSVPSLAVCFRALVSIACVILAFLIVYTPGGFWKKVALDVQQPLVHFTGDGLFIFEGKEAGQEAFWSWDTDMQSAYPGLMASGSVQVAELDDDTDGKPDVIEIRGSFRGDFAILSVKALLQLTYVLKGAVNLKMYTSAYFHHASPVPGSLLYVDGKLALSQDQVVLQRSYHNLYDFPLMGTMSGLAGQADTTLNMADIIRRFQERRVGTTLQDTHHVWKGGAGEDIQVVIRLHIPKHQVVYYRPTRTQMLKWGWVQFLSVFLVLQWLARYLEEWMFANRILPTRVVSDVQRKVHNF